MAGMFGFSCFKESNCIKVKKGRGGYWYRAIDPPAVVKIDIPVRTAYNKAIAAAAPEMKMTAQRQKCRDSP